MSTPVSTPLRSYTVIPKTLYVERDADRQLLCNLEQMERPAYVLVARQMGKTNLLLHTKECLDSANTRLVYVDLSTAFEDERECFRRIIDCAIDSNQDLFEGCQKAIDESRKVDKPPAREHESELRILLRAFPGKLIFILDEIDSLTNATYSDRVFAHIRSIYFVRSSISEFRRLTYVLSGVVEPSEIIKDKRISPFNIGEKIYLEDFSEQEVTAFIEQAGLSFPQDVIDRIYFWTGGNPRMMWDVSSLVSNIENEELRTSSVDDAVQHLYLNDFLSAPIDHIRQLVVENADLRHAVWELVNGSGDKISGAERSKMFLAGITKSASQSDRPELKNEVIKQALDKEWLEQVALDQSSLLAMAEHSYFKGEWEKALNVFRRFLEMVGESSIVTALTWWEMGRCADELSETVNAETYYERALALIDSKDPFRWDITYSLGQCSLVRNNIDKAESYFSQFVQAGNGSPICLRGLINLMGTHLRRKETDSSKVEEVYKEFIRQFASLDEVTRSRSEISGLQGLAMYNLGMAFLRQPNMAQAAEIFRQTLEFVAENSRPMVYVRLAGTANTTSSRQEIVEELNVFLRLTTLSIDAQERDNPLAFTKGTAVSTVAVMAWDGHSTQSMSLCSHLCEKYGNLLGFNEGELALEASSLLVRQRRNASAVKLLESAMALNLPETTRFEICRLCAWASRSKDHLEAYLKMLEHRDESFKLALLDMNILARFAGDFTQAEDWRSVINITKVANTFRHKVDDTLKRNFVALDTLALMSMENLGFKAPLKEMAKQSIRFVDSLPVLDGSEELIFDELEMAKAVGVLRSYAQEDALPVLKRKIGRNDKVNVRFADGRVRKAVKYKNVMIHLAQGECQIIE